MSMQQRQITAAMNRGFGDEPTAAPACPQGMQAYLNTDTNMWSGCFSNAAPITAPVPQCSESSCVCPSGWSYDVGMNRCVGSANQFPAPQCAAGQTAVLNPDNTWSGCFSTPAPEPTPEEAKRTWADIMWQLGIGTLVGGVVILWAFSSQNR